MRSVVVSLQPLLSCCCSFHLRLPSYIEILGQKSGKGAAKHVWKGGQIQCVIWRKKHTNKQINTWIVVESQGCPEGPVVIRTNRWTNARFLSILHVCYMFWGAQAPTLRLVKLSGTFSLMEVASDDCVIFLARRAWGSILRFSMKPSKLSTRKE